MNNDILFAFSIFQLTFLLLDAYILTKTGRDIARKGEYTWFCILTITHMVYLILNCLWTLQEYDQLHMPRWLQMLVCTASLWTVTNCATAFFFFIGEKMRLESMNSNPWRWLRVLPAAICTLLILTSPWTGLVFSMSPEGYFVHESLYLPTLAVASVYLLGVAGISTANMVRARTGFQRQTNGAVLSSVMVLFLFIVLDGMMTKASLLPAAVFAVIVLIFVTMQESNINSDALTGMNNRRKAVEYLTDKISNVSATDPLYLYIGDLDGFKGINDTYGHIEGDEALILCSRALKRTIGKYNGFAARYGGDEFLLAWQPGKGKEVDPESLVEDVKAFLKEISAEKPYRLAMTMGYTRCTDPREILSICIDRADDMLYERKAKAHVER